MTNKFNEFGIYDDDIDIKDIDFSEGDFDVSWFSQLDEEKAEKIITEGEKLGEFDNTGSTWWSVIKLEDDYYVSMTDFNDVFEVNKTILNRI